VSRSGSTTRDRHGSSRRRAEGRGSGRRGAERSVNQRRGTTNRSTGPVTPMARRARRNRRPRGRRRLWLQVAGALAAVAVLGWLLLAGPVLAVRAVRVDGLDTLPVDQVREAAGIAAGTPLLRVDLAGAAARVARLPQVASVEVTRDWPGSVVVTVVERLPIAVVGEAGRRSLVDAEGVLFDTVTGDAPDGVVPLDVSSPGPEDPATMAGVAALRSLPADVRAQVAAAAATGPDDISLTLTDGTTVLWGDASKSRAKSAALVALLDQIAAGRLEPAGTIDVSTPGAVALR
jgi:cell division protein FtsQ